MTAENDSEMRWFVPLSPCSIFDLQMTAESQKKLLQGGGDYGAKTPGRYISGASGLPMKRPGPGGKGLEASEKRRLQKENEKRADLSDLV